MDLSNTTIDNQDSMSYYLFDFWQDKFDQRVDSYPLLNTPWPMIAIMSWYLIFVLQIGPNWMKNRQPFELRIPMIIYNVTMVLINSYFLFETLTCLDSGRLLLDFKFPPSNDHSSFTLRIIRSSYLYWLTKFIDLLDTVFFVLRKKNNQVSVLHVYHHTSVPLLGWLAMKLCPKSPPLLLFASINSLIHVLMYSYYALAALGPEVQRFLWWKKYLTQLQLLQFVVLGCYGLILAKFQTGYPPSLFFLGMSQPPLFFVMFFDFYLRSYKSRSAKKLQ